MMQPKISIVLATFNGATRLPLQLEALHLQSDAPAFEVIVVNNGSTDQTSEVAKTWSDRLNLQVIEASEQQGIAYARNAGVAHSRSGKLAFCDDDDVVGEHWIWAAHTYLEHHEFVSGNGVEFPAHHFTDVRSIRTQLPSDHSIEPATPVPLTGDYPILLGGNCAIRKDTLSRLGGFDPRFDPGAEEKDLTLRFLAEGGTLMFAPSMCLAVRLRETQSKVLKRNFQHGRMYMKLVERHGLRRTSPVLHDPDYRVDFLRALAAVPKGALHRSTNWPSIGSRIALRAGQIVGAAEHIYFPRLSAALGKNDTAKRS